MDKAIVTGQFNLQNQTTARNIISFDLADIFGSVDSILEHNKVVRQIILADGDITLDKGGVTDIRGFLLSITEGSGTITLKHDSNTNGMTVSKGILFFGSFDVVKISTTSTQPITVEYLFFE